VSPLKSNSISRWCNCRRQRCNQVDKLDYG